MMDHRPTWQHFLPEKKNDEENEERNDNRVTWMYSCYIPRRIGDGSRIGITGERRI
jgi:hypothetical protein